MCKLKKLTESISGFLSIIVIEVDKFSLASGTMRAVRVRSMFKLKNSLIPRIRISFKNNLVWIEIKYERSPHICYGCGKISHGTKYCEIAREICIGFGDKNDMFRE